MAAPKKVVKQSSKIRFNDLDTKLRVLLVAVAFGVVGILFLSVSDAAPLTWQNRIKLFNSNQRRTNTNYTLPSTNTTTNTGGQTVKCGSSGGNASITTGDATSSSGGYSNTGGNVACGQ